MKAQMRFQKILCLVMLILGALATVYAFCYCSGSLSELGQVLNDKGRSEFKASAGKYDATLFLDIQGFNDLLMYLGIVMILFAVLLYITGCNKRRNYYITNYVATGVCAGGNIIFSIILMAMNGVWMGRFNNVDFASWAKYNADNIADYLADAAKYGFEIDPAALAPYQHYSESNAWFAIGFVLYTLIIIASALLILNLVWKIFLMRGEKQLLNGAKTVETNETVEGGAAV